MTTYNAKIEPGGARPVFDDPFTVKRTVTDVASAVTLDKAWLTVKSNLADLDADAELQLTITGTATDDGQITDDATGKATGEVTFTVSTAAHYTNLVAGVTYEYDISILYSDQTLPQTLEKGTVRWEPEVTKATS